jgi:hypothetical protein
VSSAKNLISTAEEIGTLEALLRLVVYADLSFAADVIPLQAQWVRSVHLDRFSLARLRPTAGDALLALVFVVVGQIDVWRPWGDGFTEAGFDGSRPLNALLVLLYTAPLAWRRLARSERSH